MPETLESSRTHVASVARTALAASLGVAPEQVPAAAVEAVASGRGDREAVARAAPGARLDLVLFDTDAIAGFVFESSRPPVIEGASTLLRELNAEIEQSYRDHVVFSAGGEGVLLTPAGRGESLCREIEDAYRAKTAGALGVTTCARTVAPEDFVALAGNATKEVRGGATLVSGTQAVLARVRDAIRRVKDARLPPRPAVPGSERRCVSCRDRAGSIDIAKYRSDEPGGGLLCEPCDERWRVGKGRIRGVSFDDVVEDFERYLKSLDRRSRYLGFLYVDGNAMGALFGRLESLARLRFLSLAVRQVFEQVRHRALERIDALLGLSDPRGRPVVSLLGGGDEVIWIVPGALAVDLAARVPGWVAAEAERHDGLAGLLAEQGLTGLSVGMGLVLAQVGYPVRYQYELAKVLQTNAKSLFYDRPEEERGSSLDFELVTDASPLSEEPKAARKVFYRTHEPGFFRTCRPYSVGDFAELLGRVEAARKERLAASQLYQLQTGAEDGREVFLNFLRYQIARGGSGESYQKWLRKCGIDPADPQALEDFFVEPSALTGKPETSRGVWISDALQLAPFLDLVHQLEEVHHAAA